MANIPLYIYISSLSIPLYNKGSSKQGKGLTRCLGDGWLGGQSGGGETSKNAEAKPPCQGRSVLVLDDKPLPQTLRHPTVILLLFKIIIFDCAMWLVRY